MSAAESPASSRPTSRPASPAPSPPHSPSKLNAGHSSLSHPHGGQGESLAPTYTRGSVDVSPSKLSPADDTHGAAASPLASSPRGSPHASSLPSSPWRQSFNGGSVAALAQRSVLVGISQWSSSRHPPLLPSTLNPNP